MVKKSGIKRVTGAGPVPVEPIVNEENTSPTVESLLGDELPLGHPITSILNKKVDSPKAESNKVQIEDVVKVLQADMSPKIVQASATLTPEGYKAPRSIAKMQTVKLGNFPGDVSASWESSFDPSQCSVFLHRVSVTSNPTGHLSAPVFKGETLTNVKFRVVRDNTEVPAGSVYLGSYSDVHVGPSMQALHVFLLP